MKKNVSWIKLCKVVLIIVLINCTSKLYSQTQNIRLYCLGSSSFSPALSEQIADISGSLGDFNVTFDRSSYVRIDEWVRGIANYDDFLNRYASVFDGGNYDYIIIQTIGWQSLNRTQQDSLWGYYLKNLNDRATASGSEIILYDKYPDPGCYPEFRLDHVLFHTKACKMSGISKVAFGGLAVQALKDENSYLTHNYTLWNCSGHPGTMQNYISAVNISYLITGVDPRGSDMLNLKMQNIEYEPFAGMENSSNPASVQFYNDNIDRVDLVNHYLTLRSDEADSLQNVAMHYHLFSTGILEANLNDDNVYNQTLDHLESIYAEHGNFENFAPEDIGGYFPNQRDFCEANDNPVFTEEELSSFLDSAWMFSKRLETYAQFYLTGLEYKQLREDYVSYWESYNGKFVTDMFYRNFLLINLERKNANPDLALIEDLEESIEVLYTFASMAGEQLFMNMISKEQQQDFLLTFSWDTTLTKYAPKFGEAQLDTLNNWKHVVEIRNRYLEVWNNVILMDELRDNKYPLDIYLKADSIFANGLVAFMSDLHSTAYHYQNNFDDCDISNWAIESGTESNFDTPAIECENGAIKINSNTSGNAISILSLTTPVDISEDPTVKLSVKSASATTFSLVLLDGDDNDLTNPVAISNDLTTSFEEYIVDFSGELLASMDLTEVSAIKMIIQGTGSSNSAYVDAIQMPQDIIAIPANPGTYYYVNITAENGNVINNPNLVQYEAGSTVELTAEPRTGYVFDGWNGDITSTDNPITLTVDSEKDITAGISPNYANPFTGYQYLRLTVYGAVDPTQNVRIEDLEYMVNDKDYPNSCEGVTSSSGSGCSAIDKEDTYWGYLPSLPATLDIDLGEGNGIIPTGINIRAGYSPRAFGDFQVEGSTDGVNYVTLYSNNNASYTGSHKYTLFEFTNVPVPTYYVLDVNNGSGAGNYEEGSVINIVPDEAPAGYIFDGWTGDITSSEDTVAVTLNSHMNVTANYVELPKYELTISANGGSVSKSPNLANYYEGATVSLTATPDLGYQFVSWSGDITSSDNPVSITMDAAKTITANFSSVTTYELIIAASNGSVSKSPDQASYNDGSVVELTVIPDAGYQFVSWSGDVTGTNNPVLVTMDDDKTLTANFSLIPTYELNITANNGTVTKSPDETNYDEGAIVDLTATPSVGYQFDGWSGDVTSTDNPVSITMDANKTVTANFSLIPIDTYTLDVTAINGSVTKSPDETSYDDGTTVELTAIPDADYQFDSWSGDVTGTNNPVSVTMDDDKTLTANFSLITKITETKGQVVQVFPMPANDVLNLAFYETSGSVLIEINDIQGKNMMSILKDMGSNSTISLPINAIPTGVYTLKIIQGTEIMLNELIIIK